MEISRVWVIGYSGPATKPCKARKPTREGIDWAMPQRNEASTNSSAAAMNRRTSPTRRASQPVSGRAMALLTANEVITQVPCSELTPRLPEMVGRATLAMVVSSTCMKVARDRPMVAITRLGGEKLLLSLIWRAQRWAVLPWSSARLASIRRSISLSAEASCCW